MHTSPSYLRHPAYLRLLMEARDLDNRRNAPRHVRVAERLLRRLHGWSRQSDKLSTRINTADGRNVAVYATGDIAQQIHPADVQWEACFTRWHADALAEAARHRRARNIDAARRALGSAAQYRRGGDGRALAHRVATVDHRASQ